MKNIVPKIAAVHDISGYGRCSTTVILPILSALGCQVCPLPTAILSNHSGYNDFFFYDCTDIIEKYYECWEINSFKFDCLYSGFLGSQKQIELIIDIINKMKAANNTLIVVDPVMGDHGKAYQTYTQDMINKMTSLVKKADIITPNMTEVCLLLDIDYNEHKTSLDKLKSYLYDLSKLGPNIVLITGVKTNNNEHINICYDKNNKKYYQIPYKFIDAKFPGTGDLFTSLFIGYMYKGYTVPQAIELASSFITKAVEITLQEHTDIKNGVLFEKIMCELYTNSYNFSYKEF